MTKRCRLSKEGKARGFSPHNQDREGEYLGYGRHKIRWGPLAGTYKIDTEHVQVRWDGNKSIDSYHRDYIEIIDEKEKSEPEQGPGPDWDESLF
jgi:hypothetical protein